MCIARTRLGGFLFAHCLLIVCPWLATRDFFCLCFHIFVCCLKTKYNMGRLFQMPADDCTHIYYTHFILELTPVRRHSVQSFK